MRARYVVVLFVLFFSFSASGASPVESKELLEAKCLEGKLQACSQRIQMARNQNNAKDQKMWLSLYMETARVWCRKGKRPACQLHADLAM